MRVAFLGTPDVAVPALRSLIEADDIDVAAVITNPDRSRGRSKRLVPPPVKVLALDAGIEVWQPARPREVLDDLRSLEVDACAVVAYGALLPVDVLAAGGAGFVNLHFSLLPRWRGAAPVQHAIRAGDDVTGVTTFVLDEGMDTGAVLRRQEVPIRPDDSTGTLLERLADIGAPTLTESLRALVAGEQPVPQDDDGATLAPKITPTDVEIDFREPCEVVDRLVRSADPAPGASTRFRDRRLKVFGAIPVHPDGPPDPPATSIPGTVVHRSREGVVVACGEGTVRLDDVQPEGKARMDGAAFANGYRPEVGEMLGRAE